MAASIFPPSTRSLDYQINSPEHYGLWCGSGSNLWLRVWGLPVAVEWPQKRNMVFTQGNSIVIVHAYHWIPIVREPGMLKLGDTRVLHFYGWYVTVLQIQKLSRWKQNFAINKRTNQKSQSSNMHKKRTCQNAKNPRIFKQGTRKEKIVSWRHATKRRKEGLRKRNALKSTSNPKEASSRTQRSPHLKPYIPQTPLHIPLIIPITSSYLVRSFSLCVPIVLRSLELLLQ